MKSLLRVELFAIALSFATAASASWVIDWSEQDARRDRAMVRYAEQTKACLAITDKAKSAECLRTLDDAIAKEERARTLRRI